MTSTVGVPKLTRDQVVYSLDKAHAPAITVASGAVMVLETYDARSGTIRSNADLLDRPHPVGLNPATGPINVEGAEVGDSLAVEILDIRLAEEGFIAIKANVGLLAERAGRFVTRVVAVRDGVVHYNDRIRLPVRPMVGVIGTAPAGAGVSTGDPGPHGGNMDNRYITVGATVHLPVAVPGGRLALGDVHATMGDGEITMLGLEICAEVTVRIHLLKRQLCFRPWIETADAWITTADHLDPTTAMRMSAEGMVALLQDKLRIGFEDAYMLLSAQGDVGICQMCGPGQFATTSRTVFPKLS
jgi:amidase